MCRPTLLPVVFFRRVACPLWRRLWRLRQCSGSIAARNIAAIHGRATVPVYCD